MFCSMCGSKLKDGAKFCYNCGEKVEAGEISGNLSAIEMEQSCGEKKLIKEYTDQVKKKIIELYLKKEKIFPELFYKKAQYYEMSSENIDCIYNETLKIIGKINDYITELYEENQGVYLQEKRIDELVRYGNTYGIGKDSCLLFLENYNKEYEVIKKRKLMEVILTYFSKTGRLMEDVPVEFYTMRSTLPGKLLDEYAERITMICEEISKAYKENGNDTLNTSQKENLRQIVEQNKFSADDLQFLILGYEKKSGIYEEKKLRQKQRVYHKLSELTEEYVIWGKTITLEFRFFLLNTIEGYLSIPINELDEKSEKIDKSSRSAATELAKLCANFEKEFGNRVCDIEKLLEIKVSDAIKNSTQKKFETVGRGLVELKQAFEKIYLQEENKKDERKKIKDDRGRWVGGGFGVGGAIKGAATAGAMNAATGVAYSSAALVGNLISSASAGHLRAKKVKEVQFIFGTLREITTLIICEFDKGIQKHYPEIYFAINRSDTIEEQTIREEILHGNVIQKKELSYKLLCINPWNWRNGLLITMECSRCQELNDHTTFDTLDKLEKKFGWLDKFKGESEILATQFGEMITKIRKGKAIEEDVYRQMQELYIYMEFFSNISSNKNSAPKELKMMEEYLKEVENVKEYRQMLEQIPDMTIEKVVNLGNQYCQTAEWNKAIEVFERYIHNEKFSLLIREFFNISSIDKDTVIRIFEEILNTKGEIGETLYCKIMYISARIENKEGKTILVYAAEKHKKKLINELVNNGADVDTLYQLIGKQNNSDDKNSKKLLQNNAKDYIPCKYCGENISLNAKFCNFCGKKQINKDKE